MILPSGISADEVTQKVVASLPSKLNAAQIAQEIRTQLSNQPLTVAEPATTTIIFIVGIAIAIAIGFVNLFIIRRRK